jgi:hypothetical protein
MHIVMFRYCHYQLSLKRINKKCLKITHVNFILKYHTLNYGFEVW